MRPEHHADFHGITSMANAWLFRKLQSSNHGIATVVSPPPSKHHHGITSTVDTPCFSTPWLEPLWAQNFEAATMASPPWSRRACFKLGIGWHGLIGPAKPSSKPPWPLHNGITSSVDSWSAPWLDSWLKSIWLRHHAGITTASPLHG